MKLGGGCAGLEGDAHVLRTGGIAARILDMQVRICADRITKKKQFFERNLNVRQINLGMNTSFFVMTKLGEWINWLVRLLEA